MTASDLIKSLQTLSPDTELGVIDSDGKFNNCIVLSGIDYINNNGTPKYSWNPENCEIFSLDGA